METNKQQKEFEVPAFVLEQTERNCRRNARKRRIKERQKIRREERIHNFILSAVEILKLISLAILFIVTSWFLLVLIIILFG